MEASTPAPVTVVPTAATTETTPSTTVATTATTATSGGISPGAAAAACAAAAANNQPEESGKTDWGWVAFAILAFGVLVGGLVWWWKRQAPRPGNE